MRIRDGRGVAALGLDRVWSYVSAVLAKLGSAIDRQLADLLLARACVRWPLLRLVPRRWMHPLLTPVARRLRASAGRGVAIAAVPAAALAMLLAIAVSL